MATNVTITGKWTDIFGLAPTGQESIDVTLVNYGSLIPRVSGVGIMGDVFQSFSPSTTDGTFSFALYGNDIITPGPSITYYQFTFKNANGAPVVSVLYQFAAGSFDLSTVSPFSPGPPPGPPPSPTAVVTNPTGVQTISTFALVVPQLGIGQSNIVTLASTARTVTLPDASGTVAFLSNNLGAFANTTSAQLAGIITDETGTGPLVFANNPAMTAVSIQSFNGLARVMADRYADVQTAINALPAAGGVVDATSPNVTLALGSLDPGARAVYLLLGPLSFTAVQITLRTNFHIIGCGSANQTGSGQTKITSVGSNATPLLIIPQASNSPAQGVNLEGLRFVGASGNTSQKGLFADCSGFTNSGLWYPFFKDVVFDGFVGNPIHLKGRADTATAVDQFSTFINVRAFRATSGAEALRIDNGVGQFKFIGCQFDGPGITDATAPNVFIGEIAGGDTQSPYTLDFDTCTFQGSNLGIQISGVQGVRFQHCHWEALHGALQTTLVGTTANYNVIIEANDFFGTVGVNAGAGFIWKDNSTQTRGIFKHNLIGGIPDKIIAGTNIASIVVADNFQTLSPPVWTSTNVTLGLGAAATINCQANHSVFINTSATAITAIQSSLGPGEIIYFRANGGPVTFTGGAGNINVGSNSNPLVLSANDIAAFEFDDSINQWNLVAFSGRQKSANAIDQTGLTANVGASTLLATGSVLGGLYRVTAHVVLTTAASVSSTLPNVQVVYTDAQTSTSITIDATPILGAVGLGQTGLLTANSVGLTSSGIISVNAKAGTVIQYQTVNYASTAAGMAYALHIRIEPLA